MDIWLIAILVVHVVAALAIIGLVLLQHGKGADMGAAFGSGSSGSLFGSSGSANFLSRTTAVLAACFMLTSLLLAYLGGVERKPTSILESPAATQPAQPAAPEPAEKPAEPDVPIAK